MNSYQAAKKLEKIIKTEYAEDIEWRGGDAPMTFGKTKWAEMGIGGGDGSGIIWEGFYDWTKNSMVNKYVEALKGTGHTLFATSEWMLEVVPDPYNV